VKTKFFLVLVGLCLGGVALAQTDTGRIYGTITDPTGAVVQDATVTVSETATGRVVSAKTGPAGDYTVNALPVAKYHVEVSKDGFKTETADIAIEVSQVIEVSLKLETGSASTQVDVTGDVPIVDTATSSLGEVIEGRQVVDLPLNGRNFTTLALMTPGVSRGAYNNNASGIGPGGGPAAETWRNYDSGSASLAVNGLRPQANNYLIDGIDNNESLVNTIVIIPAIEDIAEFKTTTNIAPAEFGRAGGAVVQVTTNSGSNEIHGSAYWFNRSKIGAADVFQYTSESQCTFLGESGCVPLPPLSRNQFGASLGGPIWKGKLFAFVDYQGWRQTLPNGVDSTRVPTALMRQGNFTELLSPTGAATATSTPDIAVCPNLYSGGNVLPQFASDVGYVYNPQTCLPFGWVGNSTSGSAGPTINMVPSANQIQPAISYLNLFPLPNIGGANVATNDLNFSEVEKNVINMNDYDARIDFVATSKDTIFGRYSLGTDFLNATQILSDSSHNLPSGGGTDPSHPRQVAVGWTHILSPTVINEFHYGWIRDLSGYQQPDGNIPTAANIGIQNANTSPLLGGMPIIGGWYGNISYIGDGGPYLIVEPTQQFSDAVSWIKGKHTFKFGTTIIHRDVNWDQGNNAKGYFWIDDGSFGAYPAPTSHHGTFTGYEDSELLAGFMGAYSVGAFNGYYQTRSWENGFFAQDDWRVNRKVTLNLGLRYDILTWPTEASNHQSNFDPATGELVEAGSAAARSGGYNAALIDTPKHDVGPRLGFAWDIGGDGKTVLRGGYGLFYYLDRGGVGNELSNNPDFNGSATYYACPTATTCGSGYRVAFTGQASLGATDPTTATAPLPSKLGIAPNAVTNNNNVIYYPKNSPNSHIQEWNIQIERALDSKTVLDVAYVGTKMGNLATTFNANETDLLGTEPANGQTSWFPVCPGSNPTCSPNPLGVGSISSTEMIGSGSYNGLQSKLTRRLSSGLQLTAAYTWSHALDDSPSAFGTSGGVVVGNNGTPLLAYERGNSDTDQRQLFSLSSIYELPFGRGRLLAHDVPRGVDYAIGGWQWNNVVVMATGTPMDITGATGGDGRPDYHGGCKTGVSWHIWLSCPSTAFTTPVGLVGDLPRNAFPGPGTYTWDTSLVKNIKIGERVTTQLRAQVYNLLNTPQFQNPDSKYTDTGSTGFGTLVSARIAPPNRELELALRVTF
jgi:Carboxypeptidase regulatory-like domain/TonB dependent receptor